MHKSIYEASQTPIAQGQFWMLPQDEEFVGQVFDDEGYIVADLVITDLAAFTEIDFLAPQEYLIYGNQDGSNFVVEALVDDETPLMLVDER